MDVFSQASCDAGLTLYLVDYCILHLLRKEWAATVCMDTPIHLFALHSRLIRLPVPSELQILLTRRGGEYRTKICTYYNVHFSLCNRMQNRCARKFCHAKKRHIYCAQKTRKVHSNICYLSFTLF